MKARHTVLFALLALYVLAVPAVFGQTIKSLSYNTTNFTVVGWTNSSPLLWTNFVQFSTNVVLGVGSGQPQLQFGTGFAGVWDTVDNEYILKIPTDSDPVEINGQWNDPSVRSNLFGSPGLSATITNGGLVFVFTNGVLASTNAP
jgi:hypothetical protein